MAASNCIRYLTGTSASVSRPTIPVVSESESTQIHTDHDGIIYGLFTRHLMCSSRSINELNAYRIALDENEKSFECKPNRS